MVVFGAGASYDSAAFYPAPDSNHNCRHWNFRPPLASELFCDRDIFREGRSRFNTFNSHLSSLANPPEGSSVEGELERLRGEATERVERHSELAAVQFYLQSVLWECQDGWKGELVRSGSNYSALLDQMETARRKMKEKVCLVTFNYDTLLEDGLPSYMGSNIKYVGRIFRNCFLNIMV